VNESLLDQAVYSQPFPTLIAILLVGGMFYFGRRLSLTIFSSTPTPIEITACYAVVVISVGFFSDLYLHGIIPLMVLKILGGIFLLGGVLFFRYFYRLVSFHVITSSLKEYRIPIVIVVGILFASLLSSIAPPTDADSLDYHLGAPLAWLDHGGFAPFYNWYNMRLSGLGERVVLFGLASGTDVLSSLIQWSGLLVAIVALSSFSRNNSRSDLILSSLLVVSAPVILFLVLNQKPYLFPASCIVLVAALYFSERPNRSANLFLIGFIIISSLLFKYTFLLSTFGLVVIMLYDSFSNKNLKKLLSVLTVFFVILVLPYYVRNYLYFGDPVSPLLSPFLSGSEPALLNFMELAKTGYSFSLSNVIKIPFTQGVIDTSPKMITTIMGFGGLAILMAVRSNHKKAILLMSAFFISFSVIILLGRPISRLMFDVYLLGCAALVISEFDHYKGIIIKLLSLQAIGVLLILFYSVYTFFPGVISDERRDQVLFDNAHGYSAAKMLDKLLPVNSVLLTDIRSKSLLPGTVILADSFQYAMSEGEVNRIVLSENEDKKITHVALTNTHNKFYKSILKCSDKYTEKVIEVTRATRNPLNRYTYPILFFKVNDTRDCFLNS